MPIIADPTPVPQIHSGVKRNGDSAHIQRGNLRQIRPNNEIISGTQQNLYSNTWEEEAIG